VLIESTTSLLVAGEIDVDRVCSDQKRFRRSSSAHRPGPIHHVQPLITIVDNKHESGGCPIVVLGDEGQRRLVNHLAMPPRDPRQAYFIQGYPQ
jgi:hypothetical protein